MTLNAVVHALVHAASANPTRAEAAQREPSFHAQGTFPVQALGVEVQGFGPLPPFLQGADVVRLQAHTRAASFGLREQTLLDTAVRDTGEIKAAALGLSGWDAVWPEIESAAQAALGLTQVPLQAHLHNALLYGPGQFFKMHQDTEKLPGMVLTLVLVWPCAHLGGHLMVHQGDEVHRFQSEHLHTEQIQWFAFYADSQHEVLPVQQGHRLVLTFNVVIVQEVAQRKPAHNPALTEALKQHFAQASSQPMGRQRLVVFLDYEYSERGLNWSRLKGADRTHAHALRSAADALGLRTHLALAEIHETWTAEVSQDRSWRTRRTTSEPEPGELIDDSTTLDHWVDTDNVVQKLGELFVRKHELCWIRETDEDDLVNSEYEGYMGNYGETLDYWYRRAAVVLWPQDSEMALAFDLDAEQAVSTLAALAQQPEQAAQVLRTVQAVKARLSQFQSADAPRFVAQCHIVASLTDPALALELLAPVSPWVWGVDHAEGLAILLKAHGQDFGDTLLAQGFEKHPLAQQAQSLLDEWRGPYFRDTLQKRLLGLPALLTALQQAGLSGAGLQRLAQSRGQLWLALASQWMDLSPHARNTAWPWRSQFTAELIRAGLSWPSSALAEDLVRQLNQGLSAQDDVALSPLLLELHAQAQAVPGWANLRQRVVQALDASLAKPLPAVGDWSMAVPVMRCDCADCRQVKNFLTQPDNASVVLAMAEARRKHLLSVFGLSGLNLAMDELRQGSPYKLRIQKPNNLRAQAEQRQQQYAQWRDALK